MITVLPKARMLAGVKNDAIEQIPLEAAIFENYQTDAHFQTLVSAGHAVRLSRKELPPEGASIFYLVFDFDPPADTPPGQFKADSIPKIEHAVENGWWAYETRKGFRVFMSLSEPFLLSTIDRKKEWARLYKAAGDQFQDDYGMQYDEACADVMRIYRLPKVNRDGTQLDGRVWVPESDTKYGQNFHKKEVSGIPVGLDLRETVPDTYEGALLNKMKAAGNQAVSKMVDLVKAGQPIATRNKDNAAQAFCSSLVFNDGGRTKADALAFMNCIETIARSFSEQSNGQDLEGERAKLLDKLERAQQDFIHQAEHEAEQQAALKEETGGPAIIVHGRWLYTYDFRRRTFHNVPVCTSGAVFTNLKEFWPEDAPASYHRETPKGMRRMSLDDLCEHYGAGADAVLLDYKLNEAVFQDRTLSLPVAPRNPIQPRFHQQVQDYIDLLSEGDERLEIWVAAVTRQDKPCAALYIKGPSGAGKSLLGAGLAKLWKHGSANAEYVAADFRDELKGSPFWWLDEGFITAQTASVANVVRQVVGVDVTTINPKGLPVFKLYGHVRFLITANNTDALQSRGNKKMTPADREAAAERLILLETSAAKKWLQSIPRDAIQRTFIDENGLAEHSLWLEEKHRDRINNHPGRFVVSGNVDDLASASLISSKEDSEDFYGFLLWYLHTVADSASALKQDIEEGILQTKDGDIYLKTTVVERNWERHPRGKYASPPRPSQLRDFLLAISDKGLYPYRFDDKQHKMYRLQKNKMLQHVEKTAGYDPEEFSDVWDQVVRKAGNK